MARLFHFPLDMTSTDIRIQVKTIQPLFNELLEKEVISADRFQESTAWHTAEFALFDLNYNRITFSEDI